ncbi:TlpA family protein disulfide reductase [Psychroserpens ponticola]|uniref:TlpA disulfide reductase family protein n=1 Tax=Psychroserpens ponticola TaxID=2932268 RepID=A0ABY7RZ06_9FLAO|nr:TlpA disulfide reductase family protein [Psychroserpens ponticola]WCO01896.1 TlpA disulfide reductase family protein [Psychroserpens ponticola]
MRYLYVFFLLIPLSMFSQHSINGTFEPASDYTYAFLYHATPSGSNYVDRAKIEENGKFTIALDSSITSGIYKIVYALPPEENNFNLIYNGKESVSFTFSIEKGLEFTDSNENKLWSSYTNSMEMVNRTISNYYTQKNIDKKGFHDIFKTLKDTQIAFEEASEGTLASTFIKANTPYIPEVYEDVSTYSSNLKHTFLSHVDFSDELLQSSDFLVDRVLAYIFGMSPNTTNDTYKANVDYVVTKISEGDLNIKTMLLEMVWSRFKDIDNPEVANYISDTYLMELSKIGNYISLTEGIETYQKNQIGRKAQNFDLAISKNDETIATTLHDLEIAEQYLVIFWSSTCGHCLDELPKVKMILASNPNLKVVAIGLEDEAESWQKSISEYPDFIHVLGLEKWDNPISNAYGVEATPTYVLLDKNKTILAKPYDFEALEKVLKKK